jgi:hypothetical protein
MIHISTDLEKVFEDDFDPLLFMEEYESEIIELFETGSVTLKFKDKNYLLTVTVTQLFSKDTRCQE